MDHRRLRERLTAKRGGETPPSPSTVRNGPDPDGEVDWQARVAHLRGLIQARRQRLGGDPGSPGVSAPACPMGHATVGQGTLMAVATELGKTVNEGIRLLEEQLPEGDALPAPIGHGEVCCFDTETTGLRGGAGLWVWMVGALQWRGDHWRLRQWWLARPGAESGYLQGVLDTLGEGDGPLVSFNGKSYDLPHLGTRLAMAGLPNPLPDRPHLDLLHLCRRRHGRDWPDCRLRTAEARLLGLQRVDDLPGSEAPRSWRDYVHLGNSDGVARVLAHNRQDLLSLARLLPLLCEPAPDSTGSDPEAVGSH